MHTLRLICIALHLLLVAFTIVIFVIWDKGILDSYSPSKKTVDLLARYLQVGLQAAIVLYSAAMVASTQQLAIRIQLSRKQYLTTTHDVALAWSGLGASLVSLWRQFSLPVSVWQVFAVTIYLGCIAILHVTIPTLLFVYSDATRTSFPTILGLPKIDNVEMSDLQRSLGTLTAWSDPGLDPAITYGLYANIIYDTIDTWLLEEEVPNPIQIGATLFNVTCGTLPTARLEGGVHNGSNVHNSQLAASVSFASNETWTFDLIPFLSPSIQLPDVTFSRGINSPDFILYSTVPFADSLNDTGTVFKVSYSSATGTETHSIQFQVMGCTVDLIPAEAELDDVLRTLDGADGEFLGSVAGAQLAEGWPALLKTESYWLPFVPSNLSTPSPSNVLWSTLWTGLLNHNRTKRSLIYGDDQGVGGCDMNFNLSCLFTADEMFVMNELSFTGINQTSPNDLKLYDLENALANMTAAIVWSTVSNGNFLHRWNVSSTRGHFNAGSSWYEGMLQLSWV